MTQHSITAWTFMLCSMRASFLLKLAARHPREQQCVEVHGRGPGGIMRAEGSICQTCLLLGGASLHGSAQHNSLDSHAVHNEGFFCQKLAAGQYREQESLALPCKLRQF